MCHRKICGNINLSRMWVFRNWESTIPNLKPFFTILMDGLCFSLEKPWGFFDETMEENDGKTTDASMMQLRP